MFHDRARIHVKGGGGGDGVVSFRREAHVPRGGPDGGDGGHGGDVVLVCDPSRRDLGGLARSPHVRAGRGRHGQGANRHGARGEDREVPVPPGTQATALDGSRIDLTTAGQRAVVARGGRGGHGNKRFATSTRQAPRFAERGTDGEEGWIELRLKLLADAGLVGLPNAGKSSLLARLTRAAPKVAGYPFTTVEPLLGVVEGEDRQAVLADIPGLIEGAADGAGLGHEFLAHVERCGMLVHLVEVAPPEGDPLSSYEAVRAELAAHGAGLDRLPELVVLSKRDLLPADRVEELVEEWRERLEVSSPETWRVASVLPSQRPTSPLGVLAVSSATGEGLEELRRAILSTLPAEAPDGADPVTAAPAVPGAAEFETEYRVFRPEGEGGYSVEREGEGSYRVAGRGVEMLFSRHDLSNEEALAYLEQRLTEMGVVAALRKAGFRPGDDVRIGEHEFELHPGG
jgi:GTP-binding protein